MMKLLNLVVAIALSGAACAQNSAFNFFQNDYQWTQNTNGMMFNNGSIGLGGFEIPMASGNESVYAHSFIFAGQTPSGEVRSHYQMFCQNLAHEACEEVHGPLKIGASENAGGDVDDYNYIWMLYDHQIDLHVAYFDCLEYPDCDEALSYPNYVIPQNIETWPAQGDTDLGYAEYLAPFVDRNGDGAYNANDGDYPNICGNFFTYQIHNDVGTEETTYGQESVGLEIHTQMYGYTAQDGPLTNMLFVRHKIVNRSNISYTDAYMGNFTDFDLGNPTDDRIATDVARSMYYVYNGDENDEISSAGPGYGDDLPAIGVKYFGGATLPADGLDNAHSFDGFSTYGNAGTGWDDGVIDNERQGLSSTMVFYIGGPEETDQPVLPIHHYNFLRGIWNDGSPMTYGEYGYNTTNGTESRYFFDGESDPYFSGTNGEDPGYGIEGGWTEENEALQSGDRRVISGSGPFDLAAGESQTLDYVMLFARESHYENTGVIETLEYYADQAGEYLCQAAPDVTTGLAEVEQLLQFKAFPNPAQAQLTIELPKNYSHVQIEIMDLQSRIVYKSTVRHAAQMRVPLEIANGQYMVRIIADGELGVRKLIKQ